MELRIEASDVVPFALSCDLTAGRQQECFNEAFIMFILMY